MFHIRLCMLIAICLLFYGACCRAETGMSTVPEGLGVNIHFTRPLPGEMRMLAATGLKWVRMDLLWAATEQHPGRYNFSAWDQLIQAVQRQHMRALLILDYGNPLYTGSAADFPVTRMQRMAFTRWAAAAAGNFQGKPVIFEMYNEPNGMGHATPTEYARLALETEKAIHRVNPRAVYIGPALSGMNGQWLLPSLKRGLLSQWAAVSVHPYRQGAPETVSADYRKLERLLSPYQPKGKHIPIFSGEWGYSSTWMKGNNLRQAKYLVREFLTNLADHIPLSIWYDWRNDAKNPNPQERHFGMVKYRYHPGAKWVFTPKPAFFACRELIHRLRGLRFHRTLSPQSARRRLLVFSAGKQRVWVAWKINNTGRKTLSLTVKNGTYNRTDFLGHRLPAVVAAGGKLHIDLSTGPQYIWRKGK